MLPIVHNAFILLLNPVPLYETANLTKENYDKAARRNFTHS